jgi:asparagine synthase (glutamine-hydrolysing)
MCGILGQINNYKAIDPVNFRFMLNELRNRGPDGFGIKFFQNNLVALGHRRLSIIDLSESGNQPLSNENETIWLTFNGEIYNYKVLRTELEKHGHVFKSNTDSEVIIHGYESWGDKVVHRLRGIFAFAIYNVKNNDVFIARDHVGVKPLYYLKNKNTFIFASEPKAIIKSDLYNVEINEESIQLYLKYGNVPGEYSIYKNLKKLKPGHWLKYNADGSIQIQCYWSLKYEPLINSAEEAERLLSQKIHEAISIQTTSDVPLGSLLSGGVDSTIVTGVLKNTLNYELSTFNIGFDDIQSDESAYSAFIADIYQTNHHNKQINASDALATINELVNIYDEPFHLDGLIPYLNLSKLVARNNNKVVLGGDGADEIFAGYIWYEKIEKYNRDISQNILGKISNKLYPRKKIKRSLSLEEFNNYKKNFSDSDINRFTGTIDEKLIYAIPGEYYQPDIDPVLAAQIMDFNCFLPDHCLTKVDRTSMSQGVEVRVPFLDIELVELAFKIDHKLIFNRGERKALLKKTMLKYLPNNMDTCRKKGFSSPLSKWLTMGTTEKGKALLSDGFLISNNLLRADEIIKSFSKLGVGNQLLLIGLEMWSRKWLANESAVLL